MVLVVSVMLRTAVLRRGGVVKGSELKVVYVALGVDQHLHAHVAGSAGLQAAASVVCGDESLSSFEVFSRGLSNQ
jgi:hypothetical protein